MKLFPVLLFFLLNIQTASSQSGCMDMQAVNYDPAALVNDGSCAYATTALSINIVTALSSPVLDECSGHCIVNGRIWAHVDNSLSTLYHVDSVTGAIIDSVAVDAINTDWEDIQVRDDYIYIGDIGNNWGNRTDLKILRFPAASLDTSLLIVPEVLGYSYSDQVNFNVALNNNSFDCEAFLVYNDSVHLFTKDWINKITKHYVFPAAAGIHTATIVDSFNVNGLVTSAAVSSDSLIVLTCYNSTAALPVFMWMMYDFGFNNFFSGNKRRLEMGSLLTTGQVEGVAFTGYYNGMVSSERFQQLVFNIPPRLQAFDLNPYLPSIPVNLIHASSGFTPPYPNPMQDHLALDLDEAASIFIFDNAGRTVLKAFVTSGIDIHHLDPGYYVLLVKGDHFQRRYSVVKE